MDLAAVFVDNLLTETLPRNMNISITCASCRKPIELPITENDVAAWQASDEHVQNYFPQLSDDQRELLISGTCGACFDAMFACADDEDDQREWEPDTLENLGMSEADFR